MNVAVVHLGFFYAGGGERLALEQVRGLRRLGHRVDCLAPVVDAGSCYPELIAEVGVRPLLPGPPAWLPGRVALWVLLTCVLAPVVALRLRRFDVVLAANQPAPWLAWVSARLFGVPYVAYLAQPTRVLHPRPIDLRAGRPSLDYRLFALAARLGGPVVRWADRVSVAGAATVLANGRYIAGVLERIYGRAMTVCPAGGHAAEPGEPAAAAEPGDAVLVAGLTVPRPYVLLTNRHCPQKQFEHAVRAIAAVPGAVLVVTGGPTPYTETVRALARELGVAERVLFTGLVADADLARLYAGAAVYVYPATEEDYGMGVVEAMGHGVPVVAWRSAGPTSTVEDGVTGFLVEPLDHAAFAERIALLLEDRRLARRMGRAGCAQVRGPLGYPAHVATVERELARALEAPGRGRRLPAGRLAVQVALGGLLLWAWSRPLPMGQVLAEARPRHVAPLAGCALLLMAGGVVRTWRLVRLLRPAAAVGLVEAFWINAAGALVNYLVPVRAGELARVWWLTRRHGILAGAVAAAIVADRSLDLAAAAAVLAGSAAIATAAGAAPALRLALWAAAAVAWTLLAAIAAASAAGPRLARSGLVRRLLPRRLEPGLDGHVFSFHAGVLSARRPSRLAALGAVSLAALACDAGAFALLFSALGVHVQALAAAASYPVLVLAFVVPAAPGHVGSLELAGTVVIRAGVGLGPAAAGGAIVLWHAVGAAVVLLTGLVALTRLARPRRAASVRPRVAVFHCGFTYSGGGERIVIEEVRGLRERGYDVRCFAPTVDPAACYPDLIGQAAPRSFLPQLPRRVPLRDAFQMAAASCLVPLYAWRFRDVDVVVGANQPGAWIAWCVSRLCRRPYVVYLNQPNRLIHPRAVDVETGWLTKRDYHLLNLLIRRVRRFVAWADHRSVLGAGTLLVNGRYIGDVIRRTYGRDAVDCPAGCHVEDGFPLPLARRFQGGLRVGGTAIRRPFVLLTNRHYPQKRFDLAIRAMVHVAREFPGVQLVVPGECTSHTAELRALVRELGLERTVAFLGTIAEADLQRLYAEAAVYVYPAPEEDFGMGVIESMARGVPVVAWNQAGPTVTVAPGETGHLARPLDVADYARGIVALLADPAANQRAGLLAHARARLFDWERHLDGLQAAIEAARGRVPAVAVAERPVADAERPLAEATTR